MFERRIQELHAEGYCFELFMLNWLRFYKHDEGYVKLTFTRTNGIFSLIKEEKVYKAPATSVKDLISNDISKQYVQFFTEHINRGLRGITNWEGWTSRNCVTNITIGGKAFSIDMSSYYAERI